jgi:hypothetical protein
VGDRRAGAFQRRFERVPRQGRAFDAGRVGLDPGQRLQPIHLLGQRLRQVGPRLAARDPSVELRKKGASLGDGLALQHLGHQRCRRGRDRAAAPLKADIGNPVAIKRQIDRHAIAT